MKIKNTDIFEEFKSQDKAILPHVANCFHKMRSGLANEIRQRYPKAYKADCSTKMGDSSKLGTYSYAKVTEGKIIVNLYGQYRYTRKSLGDRDLSYDAIYDGLRRLFSSIKDREYKILFPMIGCGLAGGKWPIVFAMIDTLSTEFDLNHNIIICKLEKVEKNS